MLAELAAANAAIAVIKESISNGGEIYALGKQMSEWFDAKSQIEKMAAGNTNDSEVFFAREQVRQAEREFLELLRYHGRAGLIDDWWQFQAERKKQREAEEREIRIKVARRRRRLYNVVMSVLMIPVIGLAVGAVVFLIWAISTRMGTQ
jgi:hypothetical protein